jgi:predicted ATPase/DNA-binding SARP family transcriptional activator
VLTVAVLGPVEVRRDGEPVPVPGGKTTEVLVRLALDAGRPVRAERFIEDLWADAAGTGRNTLQSKVSQLRRALGDPGLVAAAGGGYLLDVEPANVDALVVHGAAESVTTARRAGRASAAAEAATEALRLFRGDVLADAGDGDWLQPHRARLEEVRLGLVEDRLAARVAVGSGGDVIGELEGLVEQYPLREGLWSSLITALYRTGRQADALAAYARVRGLLLDQLGVDPGPGLRSLEEQILQQSPALGADPARPVLTGGLGNLPALTSDLVGRADELATLRRQVGEHRLVTVVGSAGVGKTRTAIEVARGLEPAGGAWLVRLDGVDPSTSIPRVVAETLHVSGGEEMLADRFAGAESLLLLDNCEHVVEQVVTLVDRLLDAAPGLTVLATSQVPLGLDGEVVEGLEPLGLDDSTALFAGRATQHRHQFVLDEDNAAVVEEVCRALDGLPLAIELAAARVKSLSVQEIARRLDDRFSLLRDPTSRSPERRRGLAGAIGWSYDLLFPDDQRGLWTLSVFAGGAPLAAAEHVLGALDVPAESAVDVVGRLADRSLVSVEVDGAGEVRYRLLDSIRAFARERLVEAGLEDAAAAAHAAWFAGVGDRCVAVIRGPGQPGCLAVVRAERANIDGALAWAATRDPLLGLRLAIGFGWTWVVLGDGVAGAARVRDAVTAAGRLAPAGAEAEALLLAGWLEASAGDVVRAQDDLDRVLVLADRLGDERVRADATRHLAFLRIQQGRPQDVLAEASASLEVYRERGFTWEVAAGLLLAAYGSIMLGDTAGATAAAEEAVELLTPIGDSWGMVHARGMLGAIAQAEHRLDTAAIHLAGAAEESERLGFLGQAALHLTRLGRVEQQRGDPDAAIATLDRAIEAARRSGDLRIAATARVTLARILRSRGDDVVALALLEQTDRWYRTAGGGVGALLTRCLLASLSSAVDPAAAGRRLETLLTEAQATEDHETALLATDALGRLAAERGDLDHAHHLLGAADVLHEGLRHVVDDDDRTDAHLARQRLADRAVPDAGAPTVSP